MKDKTQNGASPSSPRAGYVYLIHCVNTKRYKIGRSANPELRLQSLQQQCPFPLELVGSFYTDDCIAQEARLHKLAAIYRRHGEWFDLPDSWMRRTKEWFYNQKCSALAQGSFCPIEKTPRACSIENHNRVLEQKEKLIKVKTKLAQFEIPKLPPKIPKTRKDFEVAVILLGNIQGGCKLTTKSQRKLTDIIGIYPTPKEAAVWKKSLKAAGFVDAPRHLQPEEML